MAAELDMEPDIAPSQRKRNGLAKLQSLAAKLSDGADYHLHEHLIAGVTLDRVRQDLSGVRGLLADAVISERAR
jgi:hypothetical protein